LINAAAGIAVIVTLLESELTTDMRSICWDSWWLLLLFWMWLYVE